MDKMQVFISHQKKDRIQAEKIALFLKSYGISVYFDEYDRDLLQAVETDDPKKIVAAIKRGIQTSTHMLCLISPNTLYSNWVPFEIGYGYENTEVMALTLKGIKNSDLPDYIKIVKIIRDIYDINQFVKKHGKKYLIEFSEVKAYSNASHPLADVMDSIINT